MNQKTQTYKLTWWPSPQDYNEAVQTPSYSYADKVLQCGTAESTILGIPRPRSGNFASVYKVHCTDSVWAVRCFLHRADGLNGRYIEIARSIKLSGLPYFADFEFLEKGIRVRNEWFPILKMEWLDGLGLTEFIDQNLARQAKFEEIAQDFKRVMLDLQSHGIAHGDLQHGNLLISGNQLRLVDYDGMFVQAFAQTLSPELGHRNYQHPLRLPQHFNDRLDDFAAWVIYGCLLILSKDPSLWTTVKKSGDDCLLFKKNDYVQPEESWAFYQLDQHSNTEVQKISRFIRSLCRQPFNMVPLFTGEFVEISDLPDLQEPAPPPSDEFTPPPPTVFATDNSGVPWYQQKPAHLQGPTTITATPAPATKLSPQILHTPPLPPYAPPKKSYLPMQIGIGILVAYAAFLSFSQSSSTFFGPAWRHNHRIEQQKQSTEPVDVSLTKLPGISLANSLMIKAERAKRARMYAPAEMLYVNAIKEFTAQDASKNQESIGLCLHALGHVTGHVRGDKAAYNVFLRAQTTLKDVPNCQDMYVRLDRDLAESAARAHDWKVATKHFIDCLRNHDPARKEPIAREVAKMMDTYITSTPALDYTIYNPLIDALFESKQYPALQEIAQKLTESASRHAAARKMPTARVELNVARGIVDRAPTMFAPSLTQEIDKASFSTKQQI